MRGRSKINSAAPLRSSFADAAFAVEERLVWGGIDRLRSLFEALKWPFERAIWGVERGLVWPLEERTGGWSGSMRATGVAALVLLAAGAAALGLAWAAGGGSTQPVREVSVPATKPEPLGVEAPPAPVLHGATPDFTPEAGDATTNAAKGEAVIAANPDSSVSTTSGTASSAANAEKVADPGPAAIDVARRFSGAFVLYETGRSDAKVRAALHATASPQLARDLLRRPPRLPANVEVPKAKVLNVVPGPRHGDTFTLSASLLRVGITSELRLDVQRDEASGEWQVMEVLG
jgi:hypothetical protein